MRDFDKRAGDIGDAALHALAGVVALAEALKARVDELEADRANAGMVADVLRLPGVKTWLVSGFHPGKRPDAMSRRARR
jgi:hypothetical protein